MEATTTLFLLVLIVAAVGIAVVVHDAAETLYGEATKSLKEQIDPVAAIFIAHEKGLITDRYLSLS